MVGGLRRVTRFPGFWRSAHPLCGLPQVWRASASEFPDPNAFTDYRRLQSDGPLDQISTPSGPLWIPRPDALAVREMYEEQGRNVYDRESVAIRPGDVVLDCGANVGVYTRRALQLGAGHVIAIELSPEPLECLRRNLSEEIRNGKVTLVPKGVWDKEDTLELTFSAELASSAASVAIVRGPRKVAVPVTTIDLLIKELNLQRVDFVKMDIEGAEPQALAGAKQTFARFRPRMAIAMEHRPDDADEIPKRVREVYPNPVLSVGDCVPSGGRLLPQVLFVQ